MVNTSVTSRRQVLARTTAAACVGLALVTAGATSSDAAAKARTYDVEGYFHDLGDGTYSADGDFVGTYRLVEEKVLSTTVYGPTTLKVVEGVDTMEGCVDRNHDGRCGRRDPKGTVTMAFKRVASFSTRTGSFVESACTHPVTGHTGRFRGGLLFMTDVTQENGAIVSDYRGTVTVAR